MHDHILKAVSVPAACDKTEHGDGLALGTIVWADSQMSIVNLNILPLPLDL